MGPGLTENGYFKWQFIPLIKKEGCRCFGRAVDGSGRALRLIRAGSAAPVVRGAQAQLVALHLLGSFSLVPGPTYGFQLSRKRYPHQHLLQQL